MSKFCFGELSSVSSGCLGDARSSGSSCWVPAFLFFRVVCCQLVTYGLWRIPVVVQSLRLPDSTQSSLSRPYLNPKNPRFFRVPYYDFRVLIIYIYIYMSLKGRLLRAQVPKP